MSLGFLDKGRSAMPIHGSRFANMYDCTIYPQLLNERYEAVWRLCGNCGVGMNVGHLRKPIQPPSMERIR